MIIEQQQVLTTHNLAALFATLDLKPALADTLGELPSRCFQWICDRLQLKVVDWHARLVTLKNSAYAWRQMVFFLALLPEQDVGEFLQAASRHLESQDEAFAERFQPALEGLILAASGRSPEDPAMGARRFLGWSKDRHWLM